MKRFLDLVLARVSVRGYRPDPVPEDLLEAVLDAARLAPSACNRQPWHFIVVRGGTSREGVNAAYPRDWFARAPVVVVVCIEPSNAWSRKDGVNYAMVDGAIAMDHLTLAAAEAGLGTCWIGAFDPPALRAALGLPGGIEPLAMTPLGFPADAGRPKTRKTRDEVVRHDRW